MEPPQVPPDERLRFRARVRTRWSDEDNQSLLNNAVFLTLLEEARLQYFTRLDLMGDAGRFRFVLAQCNARFLRPGRGGREVEVRMATVHLGRSSFRQAYRVADAGSGEIWCEAESRLVAWDSEAGRRLEAMDPDFRRALAEFEGLAG